MKPANGLTGTVVGYLENDSGLGAFDQSRCFSGRARRHGEVNHDAFVDDPLRRLRLLRDVRRAGHVARFFAGRHNTLLLGARRVGQEVQ